MLCLSVIHTSNPQVCGQEGHKASPGRSAQSEAERPELEMWHVAIAVAQNHKNLHTWGGRSRSTESYRRNGRT